MVSQTRYWAIPCTQISDFIRLKKAFFPFKTKICVGVRKGHIFPFTSSTRNEEMTCEKRPQFQYRAWHKEKCFILPIWNGTPFFEAHTVAKWVRECKNSFKNQSRKRRRNRWNFDCEREKREKGLRAREGETRLLPPCFPSFSFPRVSLPWNIYQAMFSPSFL